MTRFSRIIVYREAAIATLTANVKNEDFDLLAWPHDKLQLHCSHLAGPPGRTAVMGAE